MNYGSVRLAKSWLPNREWFDGKVQEDDWGFPLHVFIGSPQQRGLLLPCWSQRSGTGLQQDSLCATMAFWCPAQLGNPRCWAVFVSVTDCHHWEVLACSEARPLQWESLAPGNLVFPAGAVEGGSSAGGWRTRALNSLMTHCLIFRKGLPISTSQSPHCKWR